MDGKNEADIWEFFMKKLFIKMYRNFLCHVFDTKRSEKNLFGNK